MKTVCVLMSTYNGERFIKQQLDSLLMQKRIHTEILIRDDGSSDNTISIIQEYASRYDNITYYVDDNVGPAKSFLYLLKKAPNVNYYAFCDQDDYWEDDKLISAVQKIEETEGDGATIPVLYHSNLKIVDKDLNFIRMAHNVDYSNENLYSSLIENTVTGCTMVMNRALVQIINRKTPDGITMHDSWCNIVCSFFGKKIYDSEAHIQYRQHESNTIGMKKRTVLVTLQSKLNRIKNNALQPRLINAIQFYECYNDELPLKLKNKVEKIINYQENYISKLRLLFDFEIRSCSIKNDLKYRLLILMGEI